MKKVLIVDDLQFILKRIGDLCKNYPLEVITVLCPNAATAIAAIQEHRPDILFLDYTFRDSTQTEGKRITNGDEVARWIDTFYGKPIAVATHTRRSEENARVCFEGCRCVTHFVGENEALWREFLESALNGNS